MKRDKKLFIRLSDVEMRRLEDLAHQQRMPASTYARKVLGDTLALPIEPRRPEERAA